MDDVLSFWHYKSTNTLGNGSGSDNVWCFIDEAAARAWYVSGTNPDLIPGGNWTNDTNSIGDVAFQGTRNSGLFKPNPNFDPNEPDFINVGGFIIPNPAGPIFEPEFESVTQSSDWSGNDWRIYQGSPNRNSFSWLNESRGWYNAPDGTGRFDISVAGIRPGRWSDDGSYPWNDRDHRPLRS